MFSLATLLISVFVAQDASVQTEHFVLHKFMQPIGEEVVTTTRSGGERRTEVQFKFTDRGSAVALTGKLVTDEKFRPRSMVLGGQTARTVPIKLSVAVANGLAQIQEGKNSRTESVRDSACAVAGYAPVGFQQNLIRTWVSRGKPQRMELVPAGAVYIRETGMVRLGTDGKTRLRGFSVRGLIWGLESLWTDEGYNLVGLACRDAEFDHFEAVRDGYEAYLPKFAELAGKDSMAELARLSRNAVKKTKHVVALTGARLFDGYETTENATVILKDDKILAVGPMASVGIPKDAEVLDLKGKTILPGLWDMHAHFEQAEWGPTYLAAGVTTVRDCGNVFEFITAVRDSIQSGKGVGPRLLLAGLVDGDSPMALGVNRVNNAEEARVQVRRCKEAGFSQMKIYSSMKVANVKAVCDEAHKLGMTVTGHIPRGMSLRDGIEAGMDQVNHIDNFFVDLATGTGGFSERKIDESLPETQQKIAYIKAKGVVADPTVALYELLMHSSSIPAEQLEPGIAKVPPELKSMMESMAEGSDKASTQRIFDQFLAVIRVLHKAGVPIVAGTDQSIPGHSLHRELELYVQAGFTPVEAIQSATVVPARYMGLSQETGAVKVGLKADLIVVDGNPLEDIKASRHVVIVFSAGKRYVPAELWKIVGFKP